MPFIRLSDNYIDNPKFTALTDGAFRLWHEGMAFTRRHQTDGVIPFTAMRKFGSYTKGRERQLATPHIEDANPLWVLIPKTGYKVHDYLEWNPSRDEENERRAGTRDRMRTLRERRGDAVTSGVTSLVTTHKVPDMDRRGSVFPEKGCGEKPPEDIATRAGKLLESYPEWYREHRHGARVLIKPALDFQRACDLCAIWDDARLKKLAEILLTTDETWVSRTDRGFGVFASKASWCDDRLKQWETKNGVAV